MRRALLILGSEVWGRMSVCYNVQISPRYTDSKLDRMNIPVPEQMNM